MLAVFGWIVLLLIVGYISFIGVAGAFFASCCGGSRLSTKETIIGVVILIAMWVLVYYTCPFSLVLDHM